MIFFRGLYGKKTKYTDKNVKKSMVSFYYLTNLWPMVKMLTLGTKYDEKIFCIPQKISSFFRRSSRVQQKKLGCFPIACLPQHEHTGHNEDSIEAGESTEDEVGGALHLGTGQDGDANPVADQTDDANDVQDDPVQDELEHDLERERRITIGNWDFFFQSKGTHI